LIWYIEKREINPCLPLIVQLGNYTLLVNNNSATNGGYKFDYYYWYKNGILIKEDSHAGNGGSYYTGGADFEANADYTVEAIDSEGNHHFSCPYRYVTLTAEQESALNDYVGIMTENPSFTLNIIGHTCDLGTDQLNLRIGQERADLAKDYLVEKGVSPSRIRTFSKGKTEPLFLNNNEVNRKKNRRLEIEVIR